MKEVLAILAFCSSVDTFDISPERMTQMVGVPAYGLYLHGSIFIREDLEPTFKKSVYIHECVHSKQEQEKGPAKDWADWQKRECEAERIQGQFLGPLGRGVRAQCIDGSE